MAKKQRKIYSLDLGVIQEFEKICKKKDIEYSSAVQTMMENYIAKDGEHEMDHLQAPRISGLVKKTIQDEINRIMSVLYYINVDVTALLYGMPAIHKKDIEALETTFNNYMHPKTLNPNRSPLPFTFNEEGLEMVENVRNYARDHINKRKNSKEPKESKKS